MSSRSLMECQGLSCQEQTRLEQKQTKATKKKTMRACGGESSLCKRGRSRQWGGALTPGAALETLAARTNPILWQRQSCLSDE
jgi:hypothetical protein